MVPLRIEFRVARKRDALLGHADAVEQPDEILPLARRVGAKLMIDVDLVLVPPRGGALRRDFRLAVSSSRCHGHGAVEALVVKPVDREVERELSEEQERASASRINVPPSASRDRVQGAAASASQSSLC